jgi:hypothetical protein
MLVTGCGALSCRGFGRGFLLNGARSGGPASRLLEAILATTRCLNGVRKSLENRADPIDPEGRNGMILQLRINIKLGAAS